MKPSFSMNHFFFTARKIFTSKLLKKVSEKAWMKKPHHKEYTMKESFLPIEKKFQGAQC